MTAIELADFGELARAAGQTDQAATLEVPAWRFLTLAGNRALGLDTTAALTNLERALALAPHGHADRASVLVSFAEAALHGGRSGSRRPRRSVPDSTRQDENCQA